MGRVFLQSLPRGDGYLIIQFIKSVKRQSYVKNKVTKKDIKDTV